MSKQNVTSCKCLTRPSSQKSLKFQPKFSNCSSKSIFTQTSDELCKVHNQQITQLLTEVAIALRQKSKLENELKQTKEEISDMQKKETDIKGQHLSEINTLKNENYELKTKLSTIKMSYMSEHKELLNELSNLKSQVLELNKENIRITKMFQQDKQALEQKLELSAKELEDKVELTNNLRSKLVKYRNKFKNFIAYIQNLLEESRDSKIEEFKQNSLENLSQAEVSSEVGTNMEDLILRELFFKPNSIPNEVNDTFFHEKCVKNHVNK